MITALTPEQTAKIAEYRERYFAQATSTKPADRPRADAAARRLAEIGGVNVAHVVWVASPADGAAEYGRAWASLSDSLRGSLRDSLWASLSDSLWGSLWASLSDSLRGSLRDSLWASLRASLRGSLRDSLRASLSDSLWASLWASLSDSLRDSLSDSLWASLRGSLRDSLRASLSDSGWLAYYSYGVEFLGVSCGDRERELLGLHNEIAASCFALWIVPGAVILCERPATVEVVDGRLVGLTWRDMA